MIDSEDGGENAPSNASETAETTADDSGSAETRTAEPAGVLGWLEWFWTTEEGSALYVRDVVTSVVAVLLVGLMLFAVSGR
jgi:signal peptidase